MSIMPVNFEAKSGTRVISACLALGRDECMRFSCSGRRNARTKVVKSVVFEEERLSTGMEGMYLKLGKRNAEAVARLLAAGVMEELVTRTLLKGCIERDQG